MNLLEKIDDVLEQEDLILPVKKVEYEPNSDELIFNRIANFIINLDPDKLNYDQVQEVIDMIDGVADNLQEDRLAKKTLLDKNQYSKKWYRANKTEIMRRKEKFSRSSAGRKRAKIKKRMERTGKTATGRNQVKYNIRKKGDDEK